MANTIENTFTVPFESHYLRPVDGLLYFRTVNFESTGDFDVVDASSSNYIAVMSIIGKDATNRSLHIKSGTTELFSVDNSSATFENWRLENLPIFTTQLGEKFVVEYLSTAPTARLLFIYCFIKGIYAPM